MMNTECTDCTEGNGRINPYRYPATRLSPAEEGYDYCECPRGRKAMAVDFNDPICDWCGEPEEDHTPIEKQNCEERAN